MGKDGSSGFIGKRLHSAEEALLVVLLLVVILTALCFFRPPALSFKSLAETKVLEIVVSMFVVSVFMERAVEAILVPIRTPDRQKIEQEIEILRAAAAESDPADAGRLKALKKKEHELNAYRMNTAKHAYWLSFVLGLMLSLAGVRALSGLFDASKASGNGSGLFFAFADVVVTGGVIAGGSAAVDKMGRRISKTLHLTSATSSTIDRTAA